MKRGLIRSFVVRVYRAGAGFWLAVRDLRSGETREFASWEAFTRYLRERPR